jgi:hypothetical protein
LSLIFLTAQVFVYGLLVAFGCAGCPAGIARLILVAFRGGCATALRLIVAFFLVCHFFTPFM